VRRGIRSELGLQSALQDGAALISGATMSCVGPRPEARAMPVITFYSILFL
jgi:hypothetical protein